MIQDKTALVVGAGRGTGRALAKAMANAGANVIAVARTQSDLDSLAAETGGVQVHAADISVETTASDLIARYKPGIVVQVGGAVPKNAMLSGHDWNGFSQNWQSDTKATFHLAQAVLAADMPAGASYTTFASGAALQGSPLSGGYAGAKRMQHYIMDYAQTEASHKGKDVVFSTIYPKQLIAGTEIAGNTSAAYGNLKGIGAEAFMKQWDKPLTPELIAEMTLRHIQAPEHGAYVVSGAGFEALG